MPSRKPKFKFCLEDWLPELCEQQSKKYKTDFRPEDFAPTRAESMSVGWDVRCAESDGIILEPSRYIMIPLGFRMFAPKGWWLKLVPRSSTHSKKHIHALYGTIDESYENQLYFSGQFIPDCHEIITANRLKRIMFGERIAQVIPVKRQDMTCSVISRSEFDTLCKKRNGSRGEGGFGSTDGAVNK